MTKRAVDIIVAAIGLTLSSPLLAALSVWVVLDSPGGAFHRARRVGRHGRDFDMYKFRTMVAGADTLGPAVTTKGDPRITRAGVFLRRHKLDELPQLWNVLRGDMSLVGPRPEAPQYVKLYTPEQRRVLEVRPGITSPATLVYRDEESILPPGDVHDFYVQQVMPAKLELDLEYVSSASLRSDLHVLVNTVLVLTGRWWRRYP